MTLNVQQVFSLTQPEFNQCDFGQLRLLKPAVIHTYAVINSDLAVERIADNPGQENQLRKDQA